ncbi:hypothetical protein [Natronocalculus amylovorans]|uniref:HIT-type domain-containing protein n=1 Tax=Natronocalculus amylovorans TaxID=2917812 RepID=A0AAE3FWH2_9EURY|nr:hypothetical protein [Natronocalculus amylovorans]MCL9816608.1 hypothetical protein [Natronocalculus amylovorans]NUE01052.1 hypothetical protein [Halorubraceae archaeon YAN]
MSTAGLCQLCDNSPGTVACELCGAYVCDDHYDRQANVCNRCLEDPP